MCVMRSTRFGNENVPRFPHRSPGPSGRTGCSAPAFSSRSGFLRASSTRDPCIRPLGPCALDHGSFAALSYKGSLHPDRDGRPLRATSLSRLKQLLRTTDNACTACYNTVMCDQSSSETPSARRGAVGVADRDYCKAMHESLALINSEDISELKKGAELVAKGTAHFNLVSMDERRAHREQTIVMRASLTIEKLLGALERLERENSGLRTQNALTVTAATAARTVEQAVRHSAPPSQRVPPNAKRQKAHGAGSGSATSPWVYVEDLSEYEHFQSAQGSATPQVQVRALDARGGSFLIDGFQLSGGLGSKVFDVIPYLHNILLSITNGDFGLQLAQANDNQGITLTYNRLPVLKLPTLTETLFQSGKLVAYAFLGTRELGSSDLQWPEPYDAYLQINSVAQRKAPNGDIKPTTPIVYPVDVVFGMPKVGKFLLGSLVLRFDFKDQHAQLMFTPNEQVARFSNDSEVSTFRRPTAPDFVVEHKLSFVAAIFEESASDFLTRLKAEPVSSIEAENYGFDSGSQSEDRLLLRIRLGEFQLRTAYNTRLTTATQPDSMSGSCELHYNVLAEAEPETLAVTHVSDHTVTTAFGFLTNPGNFSLAHNVNTSGINETLEKAMLEQRQPESGGKLQSSGRSIEYPLPMADPRRQELIENAHSAARKIFQMFAHLGKSTPRNVSKKVKILQSAPTAGYMALYNNLTAASKKNLIAETKNLVNLHYDRKVEPQRRKSAQTSSGDGDKGKPQFGTGRPTLPMPADEKTFGVEDPLSSPPAFFAAVPPDPPPAFYPLPDSVMNTEQEGDGLAGLVQYLDASQTPMNLGAKPPLRRRL